jgi:murein DD-endopeptidase MepM/ murein hydrolase activator NlpD
MLPLKGDESYWRGRGVTQAWHANPGSGYPTQDASGAGWHNGVDFGCATGSSVRAAWQGRVVKADFDGGYGRHIRILHPDGCLSIYGHMTTLAVEVGAEVAEGVFLGLSGGGLEDAQRGMSTGPHLHFEVRSNPFDARTCRDPLAWIDGMDGNLPSPYPLPGREREEGALVGAVKVAASEPVRLRERAGVFGKVMGLVQPGKVMEVAPGVEPKVIDGMEWVPVQFIYWVARGPKNDRWLVEVVKE